MNDVKPLELWFEFASTYSYVALHQVAKLDVPVVHRPFLLGPIFAAQGWNNSPFNIYPVKGRYMWRDMERLCADAGIAFARPSTFPRGSLVASRLAVCERDAAWMPEFCRRVLRANFAEDREIGEPSVIAEILGEMKVDPSVLSSTQRPAVKQALKEQTERAISLGIFGAPTFVVGEELFWGSDRMEQAIAWWRKQVTPSASSALHGG
jgi:2-hydroxychromene-2-carboxylate isomerase